MSVNPDEFQQQEECFYKGERYSARDNGAVFRHARKNKALRKYDNKWTFGKPNNFGYMLIASEMVHRIVAHAFIGAPQTNEHIVDHIDTNRQNNRPENLRWLTKLENILNNPITVKKIEFHCGSIEVFLRDPSILKNYVKADRNFEWMRTVTPEEAQISWQHLSNWAKKKEHISTNNNSIYEWLFQDLHRSELSEKPLEFVYSKTPNAVQKNWKTPSEFPCCPLEVTNNPISAYLANLKAKKIFSRNEYSSSIIVDFAKSKDKNILWVMCESDDDFAIKPWTLASVTYENNLFIHTSLGSFFKKVGAEKYFTLAQGLEWSGGDTFDDFA